MGSRRIRLIWVGAAVLFLVVLAGWVFHVSLIEQRRPVSAFGAGGSNRPIGQERDAIQQFDPNRSNQNSGMDPHVQETLRTINEINRINQINLDLRNKQSQALPINKSITPGSPLPVPEPIDTTTQEPVPPPLKKK